MRFGLREVVFVLLLLAMPASAYLMVFQQRTDANVVAEAECEKIDKKIKLVSKATAAIPNVAAEIDKLKAAIEHFQSMLPTDREVETLLRQVWDIAGKHGLVTKSVRPDKVLSTAQYAELPIKMEIVGDFFGFYEFIREIEALPRITRMPKLSIEREKKEDVGMIKAKLVLSIFFEDEDAASRS
ncbi:MAG: type 4a pilus biogenesis protein PilO [Algisphaera sp.]